MVPGSTFRYGSSFRKRTLYPRACRRAPRAADARPFPKEETTPPVMKINRAMEGQHGETYRRTQVERFVEPIIVAGFCKVSAKLIESEYKSALPHHEHDSC